MEYLLDKYVFNNIPYEFSEDTRKGLTKKALNVVAVSISSYIFVPKN